MNLFCYWNLPHSSSSQETSWLPMTELSRLGRATPGMAEVGWREDWSTDTGVVSFHWAEYLWWQGTGGGNPGRKLSWNQVGRAQWWEWDGVGGTQVVSDATSWCQESVPTGGAHQHRQAGLGSLEEAVGNNQEGRASLWGWDRAGHREVWGLTLNNSRIGADSHDLSATRYPNLSLSMLNSKLVLKEPVLDLGQGWPGGRKGLGTKGISLALLGDWKYL
jgi:hypothetical protein